MIDIFARWVDGKLVCEPKKRRGMTKGEYLRAVYASAKLNGDESPIFSEKAVFLPCRITHDLSPSSLLPLSVKKNKPEPEPIAIESRPDDVRQPTQLSLFCIPDQ